jgi:carboxymethylenebutenolidase
MTGQQIAISGPDGSFAGYLAVPAAGRGAGIVVIQEIFGINGAMRAAADALAADGFFALVPDLFWRLDPGVELTDNSDAEWKRAFALMRRFDANTGVGDIQTTINHLRTLPGCNGKVGVVGYCLGGLLAYLTAARTDSDASVGYYGVNIQTMLDEAQSIKKPLMLHIAGKDEYTPPEAQEQIVAGLAANPLVSLHRYPEMNHAFARVHGQHYDQANAGLANSRTAMFLRQHLR